MARRRRADVREVDRCLGQQLLDGVVPAGPRQPRCALGPPSRQGVGRRDDLDVAAAQPAGHMSVQGDVAETDDRSPKHFY